MRDNDIIRVFPRKTRVTPNDRGVRINCAPDLFDQADRVLISVAFTWDLKRAEELEKQWKYVAKTQIGGPATGQKSENFIPGLFIKNGYTITSRGCPNRCWFCSVWKREGTIRELPICDGWNVLDDNILACSDSHIMAVFKMLSRQKHRVEFTGGLEAKLLQQWHVDELIKIKPKQIFFAYDTDDDYDPLVAAGEMLLKSGFTRNSHVLRCYVLCGFPGDKIDHAERRLIKTLDAGFIPMAMLWRNPRNGIREREWSIFQRKWARPAIICGTKQLSRGEKNV